MPGYIHRPMRESADERHVFRCGMRASRTRIVVTRTDCIGCGCVSLTPCGLVNADDALAGDGAEALLLGGDV